MSHDLRAKVIRLAHSRPDLRPHLLPLLSKDARTKEAWMRLPDSYFDFGYEGPNAEAAGLSMAGAVRKVVTQMKEHARTSWKELAATLVLNKRVDVDPQLSRKVVAIALRDTYQDLTEKSEKYFSTVP